MLPEEITEIFDRQASSYDQKWSNLAPINSALHLLTMAVLGELSPTANILCVGSGTGAEIIQLAQKFPQWRFTAVEPSTMMLNVFRGKAEEHGILSRCSLHAGYLESLPPDGRFDAATAFLVSQFILDRADRSAFFRSIAQRLRPDGLLISSDLAGDLRAAEIQGLLGVWFQVMNQGGIPADGLQKMREAYSRDVAVLPTSDVYDLIMQGGFESPVQFFQAGLIHAWYARRSP